MQYNKTDGNQTKSQRLKHRDLCLGKEEQFNFLEQSPSSEANWILT
jgi:hypothetical protein